MSSAAEARATQLHSLAVPLRLPLAYALKEIGYSSWASEPLRATTAAATLAELARFAADPEIDALAAWTAGLAAITEGAMAAALTHLDAAAARFLALGKDHTAATTQVSTLIALAMLGRYDEAVACGLQARDLFLANGDTLAAGKIEQNLGTMAWRRDRYPEAEQFHQAAYTRFAALGEAELLVAAENGLANVLALQLRLREAAERYERALARAQQAGLAQRQAEIECNLGNLALAQGHYHQALDYLERSRRRYSTLGMPHETAFAEQELAEAYLDLNMAAEASVIYARVTPTFAALGLRVEQAWALAHHGRATLLLGQYDDAAALFAQARQLFMAEDNSVNTALVGLFEAQLALLRGDHTQAITAAQQSELIFAQAGVSGRALLARLLRGEALRASGQLSAARALLAPTLHEAEQRHLPQIAYRCHTALGLIAELEGDRVQAELALERAVAIIEGLRAPLPSEELRAAFGANQLDPYAALIRLCLAGAPARVADALGYAERARARALVEMLGRAGQALFQPRDAFEAQLLARLTQLREELNWLNTERTHTLDSDDSSPEQWEALYAAMQEREAAITELSRQLQLRGGALPGEPQPFDLAGLQADLGPATMMVAYFSLDGEILAFVVTDTSVEVVRALADEAQIEAVVSSMRFQIEALRRGAYQHSAHREQLFRRARHQLGRLYQLLLAPLAPWLGERRLVVVPHRSLHYVPFHALHDGERYLIEAREVCTVPSASVLHHCLSHPQRPNQRALLLGMPDARAPHVQDEIVTLGAFFPEHVSLLGPEARADELRRHAPTADLLHLACHGSFRPDNPLFSALHLADGLFTMRDAYALELHCNLVVLSACETGVSTIAPGDELIGLARGFFAAGAPALIVSLWAVDDASTVGFMTDFYSRLQAGDPPASALRAAQSAMLVDYPHPFFWAPFVLMGRW